jgi:hypothetical protein
MSAHSGPGNRPALGIWHCYPTTQTAALSRGLVWALSAVAIISLIAGATVLIWWISTAPQMVKAWLGETISISEQWYGLASGAIGILAILVAALIGLFARRAIYRLGRGNFHVSVELKSGEAKAVTGTIRFATEQKGAPYKDAVARPPYDFTGPQAAVLQNVLPALMRMQRASHALLAISGDEKAWTFKCRRELLSDTVLFVFLFLVPLAVSATSVIALMPPAVSVAAGGLMVICVTSLQYRIGLPAKLYLRTEARPGNVVYVEWMEHHGYAYGSDKQWAVMSNDQALTAFCKGLDSMRSTISMDWEIEVEADPFEQRTAHHAAMRLTQPAGA